MKRKLIIVLFILLILSIAIGTSPIVDYFYSLGAEEAVTTNALETSAPETSALETSALETAAPIDEISPKTVVFAVALSTVTVIAAFIVYLRKRKV